MLSDFSRKIKKGRRQIDRYIGGVSSGSEKKEENK